MFETETLKDAYHEIGPSAHGAASGYDEDALRMLLRYFADWGPVREDSLIVSPAEALDSLTTDEKRGLYNDLTKRLAENLREQHSRNVDQQSFEAFLHRIADDPIPQPLATCFLRHLWRMSRRLHEYEQELLANEQRSKNSKTPDSDTEPDDLRPFITAIHRLPSEFLDRKETQYEGDDKINRVRYQVLQQIQSEGQLTVETLREYQQVENQKHETNIAHPDKS